MPFNFFSLSAFSLWILFFSWIFLSLMITLPNCGWYYVCNKSPRQILSNLKNSSLSLSSNSVVMYFIVFSIRGMITEWNTIIMVLKLEHIPCMLQVLDNAAYAVILYYMTLTYTIQIQCTCTLISNLSMHSWIACGIIITLFFGSVLIVQMFWHYYFWHQDSTSHLLYVHVRCLEIEIW